MTIFDLFTLLGGLGLFLYGMDMMGKGLESAAGNRLKTILEKLTSNRLMGVLVGTLVTCVIQSSSATTVMVVGFVNAGLMNLSQAFGVILGANIGTTYPNGRRYLSSLALCHCCFPKSNLFKAILPL